MAVAVLDEEQAPTRRRLSLDSRKPPQDVALEVLRSGIAQSHDWRTKAGCKNLPIGWFFDESENSRATKAGLRCCVTCPVRDDCLTFSLTNGELSGVWGGVYMTPRRFYTMRRDLRKKLQIQAASIDRTKATKTETIVEVRSRTDVVKPVKTNEAASPGGHFQANPWPHWPKKSTPLPSARAGASEEHSSNAEPTSNSGSNATSTAPDRRRKPRSK